MPAAERSALLDGVMARYQEGESVWAIAQSLQCAHTTLYRMLIADRPEAWRDAKVSHALANLETAEEELRTAPDALALSRAREVVRSCQWQLERLMRSVYGQQDHADHTGRVTINIQLDERMTNGQQDIVEIQGDTATVRVPNKAQASGNSGGERQE